VVEEIRAAAVNANLTMVDPTRVVVVDATRTAVVDLVRSTPVVVIITLLKVII
jgi:ABC-type amino acid transport system permease subunit